VETVELTLKKIERNTFESLTQKRTINNLGRRRVKDGSGEASGRGFVTRVFQLDDGTAGGTRTHKSRAHSILSRARLPIPPPRHSFRIVEFDPF
jgi:hypothetical protein